MHNINFIRENTIEFDNAMKQRGEQSLSKKILEIDEQKTKYPDFITKSIS